MVLQTKLRSVHHFDSTPLPSFLPNMRKLLVLRARMAARKQHLSQALCSANPQPLRPLKKRRLARKTVRFNETQNTYRSRHASADDLKNAWLQPADYRSIRSANRATILAISKVQGDISLLDANEFCVRGLEEQFVAFIFCMPRNRQRKFSKLVLEQQSDPDNLGQVSARLSRADVTKALKNATIDAFR